MENMYRLPLATDRIGQSLRETQRRFLAKADPGHDHELEEAVLRHGCFVLSHRGPLRKAIAMPEPKDPLDPWWILSAVGVSGLLLLLLARPRRRRRTDDEDLEALLH